MNREKRKAKIQEKANRNAARLRGCKMHNFDWKGAYEREVKQRKVMDIILPFPIYAYLRVRCKNCGGTVQLRYAMGYMDAVGDARNLNFGERTKYYLEFDMTRHFEKLRRKIFGR